MSHINFIKNEKLFLIVILGITCQSVFAAQSLSIGIPNGTSAPGCDTTQKCYMPSIASVGTNGNVTWVNNDSAAHTVTSGNPMSGADGKFDSGAIAPGNAFSHVFDQNGNYDYFCTLHPWMVGSVSAVPTTVTIEFDQKVYSWTAQVYITVVWPAGNMDGTKKDSTMISLFTNTISHNYMIEETGTDTGIFTGSVILTGFPSHDADGDGSIGDANGTTGGAGPNDGFIKVERDDIIGVEGIFDGMSYSNYSSISWDVGEISWDSENYQVGQTGTVTVIDPDINLDPTTVDDFIISVHSDSDAAGIELDVIETAADTGIFKGDVIFTAGASSENKLRVTNGDAIIAEYVDHTLPSPHPISSNVEIIQYAKIGEGMAKKITFPEKRYFVTIEADSEFSDVEFNKDQKRLSFTLQEMPEGRQGTLVVHIPRNQLDGEFTVTFDGKKIPFSVSSDIRYNHLAIPYSEDPEIDIHATISSSVRAIEKYDVEYWWNPSFDPINPPTLDKNNMILNLAFFRAEMPVLTEFLLSVYSQNRADSFDLQYQTNKSGIMNINLTKERFANRDVGESEIYEVNLRLQSINRMAVDSNPIRLGEPITVVPEFPSSSMIMVFATSALIFFFYRLTHSLKKNPN